MTVVKYNSPEFDELCSEIRRCHKVKRKFRVVEMKGGGVRLLTGQETTYLNNQIGGVHTLAKSYDR